jgi:hypothetical protein
MPATWQNERDSRDFTFNFAGKQGNSPVDLPCPMLKNETIFHPDTGYPRRSENP